MLHPPLRLFLVVVLIALAPPAESTTWYVAGNGVDGPGCGTKDDPCRSISHAIDQPSTIAGDKILVGPGTYGDLNGNGVLGETGEETPAPGCGCVLAVNKPISLTSTDGAGATMIDARTVSGANGVGNVVIFMDGGEFGRPGKGFTVTNTGELAGDGIVIDSQNVAVRGNQIVKSDAYVGFMSGALGIETVDYPETILIEGNQVIGWHVGIRVRNTGKTVRKNEVSLNSTGISADAGSVIGNVVLNNRTYGLEVTGAVTVVGNAVLGNSNGVTVTAPFSGMVEKNNIFGNRFLGLVNNNVLGLVVPNNFWGAPTGPGPDPADTFYNSGFGSTDATPPATKPFNVKAPIKS